MFGGSKLAWAKSPMHRFYVYMLSSERRSIYIGMTNNLRRRISEHKSKSIPGFTRQYNITRLVHFEEYPTAKQAVAREKQLKGWSRAKKIALIEAQNPK